MRSLVLTVGSAKLLLSTGPEEGSVHCSGLVLAPGNRKRLVLIVAASHGSIAVTFLNMSQPHERLQKSLFTAEEEEEEEERPLGPKQTRSLL